MQRGQGQSPPGEKLVCKKKGKYYQYYIDDCYASKKTDLARISELAVNEYRSKLLPVIDKELNLLKKLINTEQMLFETYYRLHEGKRILISPEFNPVDEKIKKFEADSDYIPLGFQELDQTAYYTNRGERVRSKSEKIIADELDRHGIPYKYEKPLTLFVDGKLKEFYPDFTVINIRTGDIKYLEHLGMMDNPYYYKNTLSKLDAYEKNGLLIGRDLLLLHESSYSPLNTRVIAEYIEEFLA